MSRRRFSEREVIATLYAQEVYVPCFRCGNTLMPGLEIEREHIHELALGGKDEPYNCRYSHKVCHAVATNGTPATTAGSSKHRIAKATQPTRIAKFGVNKEPLDKPREKDTPGFKSNWRRKTFEKRT